MYLTWGVPLVVLGIAGLMRINTVAVIVGIIALAGVDAETGVVMLLYLGLSWDHRAAKGALRTVSDMEEAIVDGAARRLRPKLMTVATDVIGFIPVFLVGGLGSDVMRRIAAPMVGGLFARFSTLRRSSGGGASSGDPSLRLPP